MAVGAEVTGFKKGDRVYTNGTASGYGCTPRRRCATAGRFIHWRIIFHAQGAAIGTLYGTAWRALFDRAHARPGETLLVHGASGGVGIAATQLARACGMRVIGTAGTEQGAALVRTHGVNEELNHRAAGYMDRILPFTAGRGVDVILEMLANVNLDQDLAVLALRGRVVSVGNRGRVDIDPRKLMSKDGAILGMTMFNATAEDLRTAHAALVAGLENGALKPVVSREHCPASAARKA